MCVCVCVCVCVYIYMCVCVCVYIYIYMCVCVCVCVCGWGWVGGCVHMRTHTHARIQDSRRTSQRTLLIHYKETSATAL